MHRSLAHALRLTLPALSRAGKAALVAVLASAAYIVGWEGSVRSGFAPATVLAAMAGCVAVGWAVTTFGFRLARLRRPAVGGMYVAVLLVVYAGVFLALYGEQAISWAAWPAVAVQLAVVYAIQQGAVPVPVRHDPSR